MPGLLIDKPCAGLSFTFWNRLWLLLSKQTALLDSIDVTTSMSKNEDDELFFYYFSCNSDATRPTSSLTNHKKL